MSPTESNSENAEILRVAQNHMLAGATCHLAAGEPDTDKAGWRDRGRRSRSIGAGKLLFELELIQLVVNSALCNEPVVCSALADSPFVDNDDLVRVQYGG